MKLRISPSDVALIGLNGVDVKALLDRLGAVKSPTFDTLVLNTCYSLVVCQFQGPETFATVALSLDLLALVEKNDRERVIADDGQLVDRRAKIVEELLKRAEDKARLGGDARELKRDSVIAVAH